MRPSPPPRGSRAPTPSAARVPPASAAAALPGGISPASSFSHTACQARDPCARRRGNRTAPGSDRPFSSPWSGKRDNTSSRSAGRGRRIRLRGRRPGSGRSLRRPALNGKQRGRGPQRRRQRRPSREGFQAAAPVGVKGKRGRSAEGSGGRRLFWYSQSTIRFARRQCFRQEDCKASLRLRAGRRNRLSVNHAPA